MPTVPSLSTRPPAGRAPVFTDVSGRRRKRMRRLGIGVCAGLLACLTMMAAGLLGGPRASFIPWPGLGAGTSGPPSAKASGEAGPGGTQPVPNPATRPAPAAAGRASSGAPGSSSPSSVRASSPAASTSPTPVANRASKTPPGLNRSPTPKPTR
jgi:hypothetical protein